MSFLDLMLSEESNPDSVGAVFKLKFITRYHVLSSLEQLQSRYSAALTPTATYVLDAILGHQVTNEITYRDASVLGITTYRYHK